MKKIKQKKCGEQIKKKLQKKRQKECKQQIRQMKKKYLPVQLKIEMTSPSEIHQQNAL